MAEVFDYTPGPSTYMQDTELCPTCNGAGSWLPDDAAEAALEAEESGMPYYPEDFAEICATCGGLGRVPKKGKAIANSPRS
jgi:hypothetical protein